MNSTHPNTGAFQKTRTQQAFRFLAGTIAAALAVHSAQASTIVWDGTNASWNTNTNWSTALGATTPDPVTVPGALDDVIFNNTATNGNETVTLDANQSAKSLTFNNTGTTALTAGGTARTLTFGTGGLSGGITVASGAGAVTLGDGSAASDVLISLAGGSQTWTNNTANAFTINDSASAFTRTAGAGATLNFNQASTGVFSMSSTVLPNVNNIVGTWASFGTGTSTTYARNNGSNTIVGLGYTGTTDGTTAASPANLTDTTGVVNYKLTTGTGTAPASFSGNTIRFVSTTANQTTAFGSTLFKVNGLMYAGSTSTTISAYWLLGAAAKNLTIGDNKELVINAAVSKVYSSTVPYDIRIDATIIDNPGNPSTVVKTGPGAILLNANPVNSFSGGLIINDGFVRQGAAANNMGTGTITLNGGGITTSGGTTVGRGINNALVINGSCQIADTAVMGNVNGIWALGSFTVNATPTITLGMTTTGNYSISFTGGAFSANSTATFGGISNMTQTGAFTGGGSMVWGSSGTATFNQANTFSGTTTVTGGTLNLTTPLALQNSALDTTSSITGTGTSGLKTTQTSLTLGGLIGNKDLSTVFTTTGGGGYTSVATLTLNPGNGVTNSYSGAIANGAMALTKSGLGTQSLSGTNTYSGVTQVNGGILNFLNTSAKSSNTVTAGASGTIGLGVGGSGFYSETDVDNLFDATLSGFSMDAASGVAIDTSAGNFNQTTNLDSARALTKLGANTLTLSGTNGYTGSTTVSAGTLAVSGTLGNTAIAVSGGTLSLQGASAVSQNVVTVSSGTLTQTVDNSLSSTAALTVSGGSATLGNTNNFSGATTLNGGTLTLGHANAVQNSTVTLSGGTLAFATGNTSPVLGGLAGAGNITLATATSQAVQLNAGNNSTTYTGVLSGGGGLTKVGSGTLTLTKTETYSGPTVISGGTLKLDQGSLIFQPTAVTASGGNYSQGGGTYTANLAAVTTAPAVTFTGGNIGLAALPSTALATPVNSGGNGVWFGSNPVLGAGSWMAFDLGSPQGVSKLDLWLGAQDSWFAGGFSVYSLPSMPAGVGNQATTGALPAGATLLASTSGITGYSQGSTAAANTLLESYNTACAANVVSFTPTTTQYLLVQITSALFGGNGGIIQQVRFEGNNSGSLPSATPLTVSGGTLDLNGGIQTVASLSDGGVTSGSNIINSGAVAGTLTLNPTSGSTTFGGVIGGGGGGTISLTKTGNGTQILSGTNTYTGATIVSGGTLLVNGSISGSTTVNVNSTATLGGSGGTIGTNATTVNVNAGGTLAPGASIGTLIVGTATGNTVNFAGSVGSNAVLSIELNATSSSSDLFFVNGNLNLGANDQLTLSLLNGSAPTNNYTIATYTGTLTGTFDTIVGMPSGYSIDYGTGTNSSIMLTVPEPGAAVSLLGGLGLLLGIRRRAASSTSFK